MQRSFLGKAYAAGAEGLGLDEGGKGEEEDAQHNCGVQCRVSRDGLGKSEAGGSLLRKSKQLVFADACLRLT